MTTSTVMANLVYCKSLADLERMQVAVKLLQGKLRPPLVKMLTGVTESFCANVWREIHDQSPPKGQFPTSCKFRIKPKLMQVALLLGIFKQLNYKRLNRRVTAKELLRLHNIYTALMPNDTTSAQALNLSDVYYILADLHVRLLSGKVCNQCHVIYAYDMHTDFLQRCPFCRGRKKPHR